MSELENEFDHSLEVVLFSLSFELESKLKQKKLTTLGALVQISTLEFLSLGFTTYDVACIKESLNKVGHHFVGEELIDMQDYYDLERADLLKYCDKLMEQRNKIRGKEEFKAEEIALCQQIFGIFEQVRVLRKEAIKQGRDLRKRS